MNEFKQPRGIIHSPEEPEVIEMADKRAQKFIAEYPPNRELKKILDSVDFSLLRNILIKIASRGGISSNDLNFVIKDRIIEWTEGLGRGHYFSLENIISMARTSDPLFYAGPTQSEDIAKAIREELEIYGSEDMRLLKTLIHEEFHALSRGPVIVKKAKAENSGVPYPKEVLHTAGVSCLAGDFLFDEDGNIPFDMFDVEGLIKNGKFTVKYFGFCALNEGITEKLARETMIEYLEASGASRSTINLIKTAFENNKVAYALEVSMVDAILKKMAERTGLSIEAVWESFKNAYLNGDQFENDKDVEQLFSETFGTDFLKELSEISTNMYAGAKEKREAFIHKYQLAA